MHDDYLQGRGKGRGEGGGTFELSMRRDLDLQALKPPRLASVKNAGRSVPGIDSPQLRGLSAAIAKKSDPKRAAQIRRRRGEKKEYLGGAVGYGLCVG